MKEDEQEKYLGDVVSNNFSNMNNIKKRVSISIGTISNIMNILSEVSLGKFHFIIGLLLRKTMFISKILQNAETWFNITQTEIKLLENMDKILLKKIIGTPISTPISAIYLETGSIPIRFIIKAKRLMFLHDILTQKSGSLLLEVFKAQVKDPVKHDWTIQIKKRFS